MGTVYRAECGCGYSHNRITAGCGLGARDGEMIKKGVPEDVYNAFIREQSKGNADEYALGNAVTVCHNCGKIQVVSRFSYRLKEPDKEIIYIGNCPDCGHKPEESDDINNLFCPRCGKKMTVTRIGLWD